MPRIPKRQLEYTPQNLYKSFFEHTFLLQMVTHYGDVSQSHSPVQQHHYIHTFVL